MPIEGKSKIFCKNGKYQWPKGTFESDHEGDSYYHWISRGMIESDFDHAYKCHTESVCCDWCAQDYKNSRDKCMDHCHNTGKFRNILCHSCNLWRNESNNIYKINDDAANQGFHYEVCVRRNTKKVFKYTSINLEKVKVKLAKFKQEHWFYFPFQDCY